MSSIYFHADLLRSIADGSAHSDVTVIALWEEWKAHGSTTLRSWSAYEEKSRPVLAAFGDRIAVCQRWMDFDLFMADMGERPDGKTIDRIDGEKDYEPGNCRWADSFEQARNREDYRGKPARKSQRRRINVEVRP